MLAMLLCFCSPFHDVQEMFSGSNPVRGNALTAKPITNLSNVSL
jgi:hypothetical protein